MLLSYISCPATQINVLLTLFWGKAGVKLTGRPKGGLVKRGFGECTSFRFSFRGNMRMYPCSGFRSRNHPNVPSFRFSFRGNIRQNFWKTTLLSTPESKGVLPLRTVCKSHKERRTHVGVHVSKVPLMDCPSETAFLLTLCVWNRRTVRLIKNILEIVEL